ncbi:hypothetical protein [Halarcobacter ebronensis]|uniref:Uncharacterized protein n=1 Tax=Halarcobacter ebronensis TaxID=1462615 RepID=A0A4V1M0R8_9BACT|nr:hypothetical protein [Halarcobacter ebronensis]QKF82336.1 hypothetical protein AEBR_1855 [Halarcobacter ebronensis]RXK07635.1 hypothetical protein CRV07_04010 [Halarcobacter ebronensis]
MGLFEDKIKDELMQTIFTNNLKTFETINSKFKLDESEKSKVLDLVSKFNEELNRVLKNKKLS